MSSYLPSLCWVSDVRSQATNTSVRIRLTFIVNILSNVFRLIVSVMALSIVYSQKTKLFDACQWNDSKRFSCESDPGICVLPVALGNGLPDCPHGEDEIYRIRTISFDYCPSQCYVTIKMITNSFDLIEKKRTRLIVKAGHASIPIPVAMDTGTVRMASMN